MSFITLKDDDGQDVGINAAQVLHVRPEPDAATRRDGKATRIDFANGFIFSSEPFDKVMEKLESAGKTIASGAF